jgi:hypothetical protein
VPLDARRAAAIPPRLRPLYLARRSTLREATAEARRDFAKGVPLEASFVKFMDAVAGPWRSPVATPPRTR